jgi:hypothetical protein
MSVNYNPTISTSGLVLSLDAANKKSYPGTGTAWTDLSGNGNNFTINASAYNSTGPKYMDFGGSYGCAVTASGSDLLISGTVTAIVWTIPLNSTANWRTLFRAESSGSDHSVMFQTGGYLLGMYDNTNATGFNSSGFSQTSLPGYPTQWNMMVWRWTSVTNSYYYYNFTYNNTPSVLQGYIASANARFKSGTRVIGAYNAASPSQFWGSIGSISMYNRYVTDDEIVKYFNSTRGRYGI